MLGEGFAFGVEVDDLDACRGRLGVVVGDQEAGAGVFEHVGEPVGRVGRVQRQVGGAGLHDAE